MSPLYVSANHSYDTYVRLYWSQHFNNLSNATSNKSTVFFYWRFGVKKHSKHKWSSCEIVFAGSEHDIKHLQLLMKLFSSRSVSFTDFLPHPDSLLEVLATGDQKETQRYLEGTCEYLSFEHFVETYTWNISRVCRNIQHLFWWLC